jgi:hypothetical protein
MHLSKCSLVRCVLILHLNFFIMLHSCSQWLLLPTTDDINKICFLISGNYFSWYRISQYYKNVWRFVQNTLAGCRLRSPELPLDKSNWAILIAVSAGALKLETGEISVMLAVQNVCAHCHHNARGSILAFTFSATAGCKKYEMLDMEHSSSQLWHLFHSFLKILEYNSLSILHIWISGKFWSRSRDMWKCKFPQQLHLNAKVFFCYCCYYYFHVTIVLHSKTFLLYSYNFICLPAHY